MITFILIALTILAISLLILSWPLFKTQNEATLERDQQNIHFAKSRLTELEQQLTAGAISEQTYSDLKLEIESNLAQDIDLSKLDVKTALDANKQSNGVLIALLCTLIPFAGMVLYQITGTPEALNPDNLITQSAPSNDQNLDAQGIDQMISAIEQRLAENPNDVQGWTVLSQTYLALERYQDAFDANLKLLELGGESAAVYTQLADSSALLVGGIIAGQPKTYLDKALAIDPQYPQALWLAGLAAAQVGDASLAQTHWNNLLPLLADSPQQQKELREIIAETSTQTLTQTEPDAALTVMVSIDDDIQSQVQAHDTVFVFATAQNGPAAPLAVKRLAASDLPTTVQLSDADAMMAQFKLSLFDDVTITARISKSGNPIAQKGDFQSLKINSKNNNAEKIEVLISQLVE